MVGLARSPTTLFGDAFNGNGVSDASPAVPRSSQSREERGDVHAVALFFQLAAEEPRAGRNHGETVARPPVCERSAGHARYWCWRRPYLHAGA